jgi:two-component system, cell cycle sensor histidine kinase and response regulator CckA
VEIRNYFESEEEIGDASKEQERSSGRVRFLKTVLFSKDNSSKSKFDRAAVLFGGLTSLIGVFGIVDRIPGFRALVHIRLDSIPLAPTTAVSFILSGLVLLLIVRQQYYTSKKTIIVAFVAFISLYGLLQFIGYLIGTYLTFDSVLFPDAEKLGPFDVKRMSPITGVLFFLSGVALQYKIISENRIKILNLAAGYGLITLVAGFIAVIGYVFGTPLLYGGSMIPLAATTAVGFFMLGCGLAAVSGPEVFFIRPFIGVSASARMLKVVVPLIVIAVLIEGYSTEAFAKVFDINHALLSALISLFFALVTSVLVVQIARVVFHRADKAEIERRRTQHDLEASEIRYRRLFESAKDGIFILNAETGEVVDINPCLTEMLEYPRVTFLGKAIWEIELFKDIIGSPAAFTELQRKGYAHYEDVQLKTSSGRDLDIEFVSNIYRVDKSSVIQCNIRDITERKQAEESLMLQNAALQSAANAIVITDREGTIISVNQAFSQLTGYSPREAMGQKPNILKSSSHTQAFYQNLWRTILSGEVWKGEIENRRKDGSLYLEEMTITPVRQARGEISHFIAIKQDITEQKKLQQELFQSQKIQSIGTLAGGVAHDFNNILAIILIYASLIERSAGNMDKIFEASHAIARSVGRGKELVRQILTFARKTDVVFEPLNIKELIHELLYMLKETFPKVITFTEKIEEDLPLFSADRTQVHQALLNLCVNARDAMPDGGSITVRAEVQKKHIVQEKFPAASQNSYVYIGVSDSGEGMDKAILPMIFDPFFTTKETGKGTGLGLAVVYGVIQSHHGFIDVESEQGRGTTFHLYFPVSLISEHKTENPHGVESYDVGGTETILFIEDEELLLTSVQRLLEFKGYTVFAVQDGKEAVRVYKQHAKEIALVLTDLGLPGISGKDELKKLREINPDVKVIMTSGYFDPDVKTELLKNGIKGIVQKPYVPGDILRAIREALDT